MVVNGEVGNLEGVHAAGGFLYWTCEVKVIVAEVVSRGLNLVLGQGTGIVDNLELDRLCSGNRCFVRNQEEIKQSVTLAFNKSNI